MAGDIGQKDPVALGRGDRRIAEQVRLVRWGPLTGSRQRAGGAASGDPRGGGRRTGVEVPSGAATRRPGGQVAEAGGQRCGRCVGSRGDRIGWRSPATTRTPREVHIGGRPRWRGAAGGRGPRGAYRRIAEQAWLARSRPSLGEAARGRDLGGPEGEALGTPRAPGHLTRKVRGVHRAGWPVALGRRTRWPQRCKTSLRRSPADNPRGGAREGDWQGWVL